MLRVEMGPSTGKQYDQSISCSLKGAEMPAPYYVDGEFEVEFIPYLNGTIGAKVWEEGEAPSHILDINDDWHVEVEWTMQGPLQRFICGSWAVDVYMESIGKGPEFELPDIENIPMNKTGQYSARLDLPAKFIKTHVESWWEEYFKEHELGPGEEETDIVYKMVCTVTYRDQYGQPGPIAGFVDMPMLQFYKAE
jgi:hypothetical protein